MENQQVSVIVRTKDRPELLKEALKSISDQSWRSIEVVIVNDGGCEVDLAEAGLILNDIPLNYVKHETCRGRAAALNSGVENSRGAYVAILDDDDIYCPSGIAALLAETVENQAEFVYGKVVCKTGISGGGDAEATERVLGEPFDFGKLLFENYIATNSLIVSREFVEKTGPFDNDFEIFEDWDWIIRMASICEPRFVNSVVGEYRMFSSSTLTGKGGKELHRFYRGKLLDKHLGKATAADFLDHVQRVVDKIVLENSAKNHHLDDQIENLKEQVRIKTEWLRLRDRCIPELEATIDEHEATIDEHEATIDEQETTINEHEAKINAQKGTINDLKKIIQQKDAVLADIFSSRSWKIAKPVRVLGATAKKILPRKEDV